MLSRPKSRQLSGTDLEQLWNELVSADAAKGWDAIWSLTAAPQPAVRFLKERLQPAAKVDEQPVLRLVANLDSPKFDERTAAQKELELLGTEIEFLLRKTLEQTSSAEVRRRLDALLNAPTIIRSPDILRGVRAVEALKRIATPEARQQLQKLAAGPSEARLTREAQAALEVGLVQDRKIAE